MSATIRSMSNMSKQSIPKKETTNLKPPEPGAVLVHVDAYEREGKTVSAYDYWRGANGENLGKVESAVPANDTVPKLSKKREVSYQHTTGIIDVSSDADIAVKTKDVAFDNVSSFRLRSNYDTESAKHMRNGTAVTINGIDVSTWGPLRISENRDGVVIRSVAAPRKKTIRISDDDPNFTVTVHEPTVKARRAQWRLSYGDATEKYLHGILNDNRARDEVRQHMQSGRMPFGDDIARMELRDNIIDYEDAIQAYGKEKGISSPYVSTVSYLAGPAAHGVLVDGPSPLTDSYKIRDTAQYLDKYGDIANGLGDPTTESQSRIREKLGDELDKEKKTLETASSIHDTQLYVQSCARVKVLSDIVHKLDQHEDNEDSQRFMDIISTPDTKFGRISNSAPDQHRFLSGILRDGFSSYSESEYDRLINNAYMSANARMIAIVLKNGKFTQ